MTRTLKGSLLIGSMLVATWATSSEACHRRRSCAPAPTCYSGCNSTGYYGGGGGYATGGGGYYNSGYAGATAGYSGGYGYGQPGYAQPGYAQPGYGQPGSGYDFGRPGYNPGGLGGPASGIGVRPGLGAGGFGPGR
jgi:hypothetical protein